MADAPAKRRIRIGFVLTELLGGGAERSMLGIIDALDRARFDPVLVVFVRREDHAPPADAPVIVLAEGGATAPGRLTARVRDLAGIIARERLDLVVSFLIGANVVATLAAKRAGVPVVIGERSAPLAVLSPANAALKMQWLWRMLVRRLYPQATAVVTNTRGAGRELVEQFRVPADRIAVIPNAVDLERIRALAAAPLDDAARWPAGPVLVHVGRFSHAKDHDTLLRAFAIVRAGRPATLVLVGDGEDEARVRALTADLGLDGSVVFTGFTRNPYAYLARATLCVLTSRFEGLPNALLEAMALGIPIVSTACQYGPIELLDGTGDGVLTPVGDPQAFASAVVALLDDEPRRRELSRRGTARAAEFDRRRLAARYEALFLTASRASGT